MEKETKGLHEEIEILPGLSADLNKGVLTIKGPSGQASKNLLNPIVHIELQGNKILLKSERFTKREKKISGSFTAHINNLMSGAKEGHVYKLKICASHFPMSVVVSGKEIVVKNFLGEKHPRKLKIKENAEVKINGMEIVVSSPNKETAGQVAADIEKMTRITNKDRRIFQDGIYITEKDGKNIKV